MENFNYSSIEKIIGYQFKNKKFLQQAFCRSSFANENKLESNEVLEFIGDKVLDTSIIRILLGMYSNILDKSGFLKTEKNEGDLTNLKSKLVNTDYLSYIFDTLDLSKYLLLGNNDIHNHVEGLKSVKEDTFEAIIGAIALDCDWNFNIIDKIIHNLLKINDFLNFYGDEINYVGLLQEKIDSLGLSKPIYNVESFTKKDELIWHVTLKIPEIRNVSLGFGSRKKEAKKEAARRMLKNIEEYESKMNSKESLIYNYEEAFSKINNLVQKGIIPEFSYDFTCNFDSNGNPEWKCSIYSEKLKYEAIGVGKTKKEAKGNALLKFLNAKSN